jgi:hypothetical protein
MQINQFKSRCFPFLTIPGLTTIKKYADKNNRSQKRLRMLAINVEMRRGKMGV